jgi:hypothetical protein
MKQCILLAFFLGTTGWSATFTNTSFEDGSNGWRIWSRQPDAATLNLDSTTRQSGAYAGRVEHTETEDWSLEPQERLTAQPGEVFELAAHVRAKGEGTITLCASTWDAAGNAVDWSYGDRTATSGAGWQHLRTRLLVPEGVTQLQPRLIGVGKLTAWVDDFTFRKLDGPGFQRNPNLASALTISNEFLTLTLHTSNATFSVTDKRIGRTWRQRTVGASMLLQNATAQGQELRMDLFHVPSGLELKAVVSLIPNKPELTLELSGTGDLTSPVRYPHPFDTQPGERLIIPMNEGISYPVEDESVPTQRLIAYGGHGICMAFWGVTHQEAGHMAIIESPDDASILIARHDNRLIVAPEWDPQKRAFGYPRKLRYVFFDRGGHVAMAKRYRAYAAQLGLVKTLAEKKQHNPHVDLLLGAVNVWCWDRDAVSLVKEMQAAGIERILWSNRQTPENLRQLNELGVLTSRYDIYQDVMDPAQFPKLRWTHSDWTTAAWPRDIIIGGNGVWIKGWGVEAKDGSMISCGVICDKQALPYARDRVPPELATNPYKCRFIDTTTAAPWHECYAPEHPMTRTESREHKMRLLEYFSKDLNLVTGCETGHDASVPYLHYFEGMLSLGPYRVPDSGRRMQVIWTNVPARVAQFQLGHDYRLPLWELVFHDCVVSQWYWGDYNNKLPALWDKRDLFNLLYGTPPMFMFDRKLWSENKARFAQSYRNICPHVRELGYAEMTDHRFLTSDRTVQQTVFSSGHVVTVNFGASPHTLPGGASIAPMGYLVRK